METEKSSSFSGRLCRLVGPESYSTDPRLYCRYNILMLGGRHRCIVGWSEEKLKRIEDGVDDPSEHIETDFMNNIWAPRAVALADDIKSTQRNYDEGAEISAVVACIHGLTDQTAAEKLEELQKRLKVVVSSGK